MTILLLSSVRGGHRPQPVRPAGLLTGKYLLDRPAWRESGFACRFQVEQADPDRNPSADGD